MIHGDDRLIIIGGMAHSGTTILAHVLQQHPSIVLCAGGSEGWILENDWVPTENVGKIQSLLDEFPNKRVMLKRAWCDAIHGRWMTETMPNAKVICCFRNFEDIAASWKREDSMVDARIREGSLQHQRQVYDEHWTRMQWLETVMACRRHYHPMFASNPERMLAQIGKWLKLPRFNFDTSLVNGRPVKELLKEEFIARRDMMYRFR